ncbi:dipeptidase [Streptomyces kunmingensis]|uniref:Dipeptidase n=1 Tax=Streptomyces kunmingensis TaxID=68225 RepID=A0ABU6CHK0_9ACTN|nr:membrane dipeptidase [Streptomyces kunmingensis]MEB3963855.1 dipeptidase [Streptomyces kunmingensis]
MADLQDELNATTEVGDLDRPSAPVAPLDGADPHVDEVALLVDEPESQADEPAPVSVRGLLARHPVADGYCGLPGILRRLSWFDLELGECAVETDLPRLHAGGAGAQLWALDVTADRPVTSALEQIDLVNHVVARYPEGLRLARSASETADARAHGRIAVLIGPAPAAAAGDSLGTLRGLHALGLRILSLRGAQWAPQDTGLTRFGEEMVRELNRLGMLIDLTGAHPATAARVLDISKAPAILTRSGARALNSHPDNASDELLVALREGRGLCLVPCSADRTGPALRDVADHLDHVRRVAGPETVGLSGMFDTGDAHPEGLADPAGYPALIAELADRGWPETDLALLTWGNAQRVLRGTEFTARAARRRRGPSTATY